MSGTGGNILGVPFRRTHPLVLSDAITRYISSKYDQHPDQFARDLEVVDQLRRDAVNAVEPHHSGIKKIQAYAAQLVWMTGKFPIDLGIDFVWYPAMGYNTSHGQGENNIRFELANVIFNLGAMYSQMAITSNRATGDGLKGAASNFVYAAGTFKYLREIILPDMRGNQPEDMDVATLDSLETLMLAQAQECSWQKAVKDGLKDALIAKLAAKVSDLYSDAEDWATKSNTISSEWIHHANAKHHHFAAAAQYRAACDCLEKMKYGEEVARLRDSLHCVEEGLKEGRYISKAVVSDLNGLKIRVTEDLKRAVKDNDTVYLIPEPTKSELKKLDRVEMATSKIPKEVEHSQDYLGDHGELGRPLFAKLIPYSAHLAASIYVQRRDRLVNDTIISALVELTERLHASLASWSLPGALQALEKPLGLPPSLSSHAEEIRHSNGMSRIQSTIADTYKIKQNNQNLYQEGVDLLRHELGEDEAARRKYGTDRWGRLPAKDAVPSLYEQVTSIEGYLKQADASDQLVLVKVRENDKLIRLLGSSNRDLEDFIPSSRRANVPALVEREVNSLRALLNEVSRLESRRRRKIDAIRVKAKEDDVSPDLLKEVGRLEREHPMLPLQASEFDDMFDKRLRRYEVDEADVTDQEREQDRLLSKVKETNASFQATKKGDVSSKERETALQSLDNAYNAYKEILRNLDTGRKFYNDLSPITTRFRDECRSFVLTRRNEGQSLEFELGNAMAGLQIQEQTTSSLRREQQQQNENVSIKPDFPAQTSVAAPTPQRVHYQQPPIANVNMPARQTWQEGMPIVFGGGANQSNVHHTSSKRS